MGTQGGKLKDLAPWQREVGPFLDPSFRVICVCACMPGCFSRVQLFATLWIVAHQAPLSMGFPRQEYWSGVPCPPPGDLPDPGIEHASPALQADSLPLSHWGAGMGLNDQQEDM